MLRGLVLAAACLSLCACPGDDDDVCPHNPQQVTLAQLQSQVFEPVCTSCHNTKDPTSGDFSSVDKTRAATVGVRSQFAGSGGLKIVDPGNLANSILWLKVLGGDATGQKGPNGEKVYGAMPLSGSLTPAQKSAIKNWVCSGAN